MDASLWVALLDLLWLVLLAFAWLKDKQNHIRIHEAQREWLESLSKRLRDLEGRLETFEHSMALEVTGLREKAKTAGGVD